MKKFAADNLLFLREEYPDIYRVVHNEAYSVQYITIEHAKNGASNLHLQYGEATFHMYSRYNPQFEAAKWVESLDETTLQADNVLIFGLGLGYHVQALMDAYPNKRIYIYEPDKAILLAAIEALDLRPLLGNRQVAMLAIGEDTSVQVNLMVQIYKSFRGTFSVEVTPPYWKLYGELIPKFYDEMRKTAMAYRIDVNTISHYRKEWSENLILNMSRNLRTSSFLPLRNCCEGIPAVIVGSGPSLGLEIDKLRAVRDRVMLIAAGSSIQGLLHYGVEPDLIVSMDAGIPNQRVFEKLDVAHIPFLYIPMIKHSAIKADDSPYLLHGFFDIDQLTQYLMQLSTSDMMFASSASVTGTAIQAALHLGCREIFFIGQDYSYPNELVYTEGIAHSSQASLYKRVEEAELFVKNVVGGTNRTNESMINLKQDAEAMIRVLPQISFFNASPVGAVIEGTEHGSLEVISQRYGVISHEQEWFKQTILERGKPYPDDRINEVKQRMLETYDGICELEANMGALEAHLKAAETLVPTKSKELERWFAKFDKLWPAVISSEVYVKVYAFFLTGEQTHATRHWEEMKAEPDLYMKLIKLRDCIAHLVEGINQMTPVFLRSFEKVIEDMQLRRS